VGVRELFIGARDQGIAGFNYLWSGCGVHWRIPFPSNGIFRPISSDDDGRRSVWSTRRQRRVQSCPKNGRMMENSDCQPPGRARHGYVGRIRVAARVAAEAGCPSSGRCRRSARRPFAYCLARAYRPSNCEYGPIFDPLRPDLQEMLKTSTTRFCLTLDATSLREVLNEEADSINHFRRLYCYALID
jgi:hypothetical protein